MNCPKCGEPQRERSGKPSGNVPEGNMRELLEAAKNVLDTFTAGLEGNVEPEADVNALARLQRAVDALTEEEA